MVIDIHMHIYKKIAGITNGKPMASDAFGRVKIGNKTMQLLPPSFEDSTSRIETLIAYMDWCKIDKALLMPNPFYGYHNDYILESADKYPDRFKGVALVDILEGKKAAEELAGIYENTSLFGFKVESASTFQCAPGKRILEEEFKPVYDCLNSYRQPLFIHMFTKNDVEDIIRMSGLFPHINYIICHMGADACFGKNGNREYFDTILEHAKKRDNIYLDTSTLPEYFTEEYPFTEAVNYVLKAYNYIGPEKLMWASDYPGMLKLATLNQLINYVLVGCKEIPAHHLDRIMGLNAYDLFFKQAPAKY